MVLIKKKLKYDTIIIIRLIWGIKIFCTQVIAFFIFYLDTKETIRPTGKKQMK